MSRKRGPTQEHMDKVSAEMERYEQEERLAYGEDVSPGENCSPCHECDWCRGRARALRWLAEAREALQRIANNEDYEIQPDTLARNTLKKMRLP